MSQVRAPAVEGHRAAGRDAAPFALPSPEQAVVLSLGWRSALADLLFARALVQAGIHVQERRRFEHVGRILDVINGLDPGFRTPYRFADTLLTMQARAPRQEDYRKAREVLLRGLEAFPYDQELHNTAGQYLAYVAPPRLKDAEEAAAWRMEGAKVLARACELVGSNENVPYHCITAARLLSNAGQLEAVESFVERMLAVSDDPQVRELAVAWLEKVGGEAARERRERRAREFDEAWTELTFVSRDRWLLLGPPLDVDRCAGAALSPRCPTSWRLWAEGLPE